MRAINASELPARGEFLAGGAVVGCYFIDSQPRALVLLSYLDEISRWDVNNVLADNSWDDGFSNTQAMAQAGSLIAKQALELSGHIPACSEAQLLLSAQHQGIISLGKSAGYWTSTRYADSRIYTYLSDPAKLDFVPKQNRRFVHVARSLVIQQ